MPIVVANRYARALADVIARTGEYRTTLQELENLLAVYQESAELREVCASPAVALEAKQKVLEALLAKLGASPTTVNFARVLVRNYRLPILEEVVPAFRRIAYDRLGIAQVRISSAAELTEEERELIRRRFSELTRQQVEIEFHLDAGLVGGVVAQIGSTIYDGSVRGHLEKLREQLTAR